MPCCDWIDIGIVWEKESRILNAKVSQKMHHKTTQMSCRNDSYARTLGWYIAISSFPINQAPREVFLSISAVCAPSRRTTNEDIASKSSTIYTTCTAKCLTLRCAIKAGDGATVLDPVIHDKLDDLDDMQRAFLY